MKNTLTIVTGAMFAGKTTKLLSLIEEAVMREEKILVIKHKFDDRYDVNSLSTHDKKTYPAISLDNDGLRDIVLPDVNRIFIDEGQFYPKEVILNFVEKAGKMAHICIAGLAQDSFGQPFGAMGELLAMSDYHYVLYGKCSVCGEPSSRTQRLVKSQDTICVGSENSYSPRCYKHWEP